MPSLKEIRQELEAWLEENFSPDLTVREWREILVDAHWASVQWPKEYLGRDYSAEEAALVDRIFRERGIIPGAGGRRLASEAIVVHGSHEQKIKYLRPCLVGDINWVQLFSEPDAGSDLAGCTTTAERDGDRYIVNGQKCWTTGAPGADRGMLVARTNWDVPKHQGLSYFLFNMKQPGVESRPIKQMNGYQAFYEVFFTDAEVSADDLVGGEGNGWAVTQTSLSFERSRFVDDSSYLAGRKGRIYDEYRTEIKRVSEPTKWYAQRAGRADLVVPRAKETGAIADPIIRQDIAKLICLRRGSALPAQRSAQIMAASKTNVSPVGSIAKLAASEIARQSADLHTVITGADAMLNGPESAQDGLIAEILLSVPSMSIAGGTDEIQKNVLAERVLELPKGGRFDKGPFRDVPRSASITKS